MTDFIIFLLSLTLFLLLLTIVAYVADTRWGERVERWLSHKLFK